MPDRYPVKYGQRNTYGYRFPVAIFSLRYPYHPEQRRSELLPPRQTYCINWENRYHFLSYRPIQNLYGKNHCVGAISSFYPYGEGDRHVSIGLKPPIDKECGIIDPWRPFARCAREPVTKMSIVTDR